MTSLSLDSNNADTSKTSIEDNVAANAGRTSSRENAIIVESNIKNEEAEELKESIKIDSKIQTIWDVKFGSKILSITTATVLVSY